MQIRCDSCLFDDDVHPLRRPDSCPSCGGRLLRRTTERHSLLEWTWAVLKMAVSPRALLTQFVLFAVALMPLVLNQIAVGLVWFMLFTALVRRVLISTPDTLAFPRLSEIDSGDIWAYLGWFFAAVLTVGPAGALAFFFALNAYFIPAAMVGLVVVALGFYLNTAFVLTVVHQNAGVVLQPRVVLRALWRTTLPFVGYTFWTSLVVLPLSLASQMPVLFDAPAWSVLTFAAVATLVSMTVQWGMFAVSIKRLEVPLGAPMNPDEWAPAAPARIIDVDKQREEAVANADAHRQQVARNLTVSPAGAPSAAPLGIASNMATPPDVDPFRQNLHVRAPMASSHVRPAPVVDRDPWARKSSMGFDDVFGADDAGPKAAPAPVDVDVRHKTAETSNPWWNAYSREPASDEQSPS